MVEFGNLCFFVLNWDKTIVRFLCSFLCSSMWWGLGVCAVFVLNWDKTVVRFCGPFCAPVCGGVWEFVRFCVQLGQNSCAFFVLLFVLQFVVEFASLCCFCAQLGQNSCAFFVLLFCAPVCGGVWEFVLFLCSTGTKQLCSFLCSSLCFLSSTLVSGFP